MRRILEAEGYQVATSASGRTAIEKIQEQDFDVVITDLKMPGMDGIEVLKTIKILQPDVPVIIITGYSTVDTAVDAMKSGAFDYIAKPFTSSLIIDKVQKAIAHKASVLENLSVDKEYGAGHGFDDFIGESDRNAEGLPPDKAGGPCRQYGSHHRRERYGQGDGGACHSQEQHPA